MSESAAPQDDFQQSFESAFAGLQVRLERACAGEGDWPHRIAAAVCAGLRFAAADPAAAQALTNDALAHGRDGIARHERLIAYLGEGLAPGREQQSRGDELPEITEQAMASGVVFLVAQRLDRGRGEDLPAIAGEAIQFVLTPYLGAAEARRIGTEYAT